MEQIILIIFLILLPVSGVFFFRKYQNSKTSASNFINNQATVSSENQKSLAKYSIEYLRAKKFQPSKIEIVEQIRTNPGFTSYLVSYFSGDLKQLALMNVPNQAKDRYPVVIVNHGYISPEVYSTTQSYVNTSAFFANNGFLVLKPDYRGHDDSETDNAPNSRLAYAEDVLYLLASLDSLKLADNGNVFMYGHSMGGEITLRVIETTDKVKAATLWAPVAREFPESILFFTRRHRNPERTKEIEKEIFDLYQDEDFQKLSPLNYLQDIKIPIIVHHGTKDQSVPYFWSENLVSLLKSAGKKVDFYPYEGDNHDLAANFTTALSRDVAFFKNNLSQI